MIYSFFYRAVSAFIHHHDFQVLEPRDFQRNKKLDKLKPKKGIICL